MKNELQGITISSDNVGAILADVRAKLDCVPIEYEAVEPKPIVIGPEHMIIPECCRNGDPNCPHVPKKQRQLKTNVGL